MRPASAAARGLALVALGMPAAPLLADELSASFSLTPTGSSPRANSPYAQPASRQDNGWRQDVSLRAARGGALGQVTLRNAARGDERPSSQLEINQLYLDHDLSPGTDSGSSWGLTVGRKILSSPIGFGFRPLDVIQQENRRAFNVPLLTGVPLLALERLTADGGIGLVASARPDSGRQREALTLRAVRTGENHELHAVAQQMAGQGAALGIAATGTPAVAAEAGWDWSWHGAALWQQRAPLARHRLADDPALAPLAVANPVQPGWRANLWKTLLGVQFSSTAGWGLLFEYWHDGSAWQHADWRRLDALTRRQLALRGTAPEAAIAGNLAWSATVFQAPGLLPHNLFGRLAYTAESWTGALEWLRTPEDGGQVLSASLAWQGNRQKWQFGWRQLGGAAGSAYALAPNRESLFVQWQWAI